MRRTLLVAAVAAAVALSGCASLGEVGAPGDDTESGSPDGPSNVDGAHVQVGDGATGATDVNYTANVEVAEQTAGSELTAVGATFPRDHYDLDGAKHAAVRISVDTDGDGDVDRSFNESHVSGVNNNEYSFDVSLDTDYTLQEGDVVVVDYPSVDNPSESGEYSVTIRLNDEQRASGNVTIG